MNLRNLAICLSLTAVAFSSAALGDSCDPKFGDQLYSWVENDTRRQSLELAHKDFASRLKNTRLIELNKLRAIVISAGAALDKVSLDLLKSEATSAIPVSEIERAMDDERRGTNALTALLKIREDLDQLSARFKTMSAPPSFERFISEGAQHVGTSSLMASVIETGDTAAHSLAARYGFSVSLTFNSNGEVTDGSVSATGNEYTQAADGTALTLLQVPDSSGYCQMIAEAYFTIRFMIWGNEIQECNEKIAHQKTRVAEAITLLKTVIPRNGEIYSIYKEHYEAAQREVEPVSSRVLKVTQQLETRWKGLTALALARISASSKIVTREKLQAVSDAYLRGDQVGHVFEEVAINRALSQVGDVLRASIRQEIKVRRSCRNVAGVKAAEDFVDYRGVSLAEIDVLLANKGLAPIHASLLNTKSRLSTPVARATELLSPHGASPECSASKEQEPEGSELAGAGAGEPRFTEGSVNFHNKARLLSLQTAAVAQSQSLCTIYRSGQTYTCSGGNSGPSLESEYGSGSQSGYGDTVTGSGDGGFEADSRRVDASIERARTNIDQRINDLAAHQQAIDAAVPQWIETNVAGLEQTASDLAVSSEQERIAEEGLINSYQDVLQAENERLRNFARDPYDPGVLGDLLRDGGGGDPSLPQVAPDTILPDQPSIDGFTHVEAAYPEGLDEGGREIVREERKSQGISNQELRTRSAGLIADARKFNDYSTPSSLEMSRALLRDAASIRLYDKNLISSMQVTVVSPDGKHTELTSYNGGPLPANSVESLTADFQADTKVTRLQLDIAMRSLPAQPEEGDPRRKLADAATHLIDSAQTAFFGGKLVEGRALLDVGMLTADLVTGFVPGVSFARDVYESVTGKNLITGETLEPWERAAAVLGVLTVGVGSKGAKILHAVKSVEEAAGNLSVSTRVAEDVIRAAHSIDYYNVETSVHMIERLAERGIQEERLIDTVSFGSRFWDLKNAPNSRIMIMVENGAPGKERVVAAVDIYKNVVTTVETMAKSDEEIAKIANEVTGLKRYRYVDPRWIDLLPE